MSLLFRCFRFWLKWTIPKKSGFLSLTSKPFKWRGASLSMLKIILIYIICVYNMWYALNKSVSLHFGTFALNCKHWNQTKKSFSCYTTTQHSFLYFLNVDHLPLTYNAFYMSAISHRGEFKLYFYCIKVYPFIASKICN